MIEPLFSLDPALREGTQNDELLGVLRQEFKQRGYDLGKEVSLKTVGTEYLLIDDNPAQNSYAIKEIGKQLAAYTAFVRVGTPEELRTLTAQDLFAGLNGPHELVYLEHCSIPDPVVIADSGGQQGPEGEFLIDREFVCRNCEFTQITDFSNTAFQRRLDLRGTTFQEGIELRNTTFWEGANFDLATFMGFAHFVRTTFLKSAHFSGATFQGEAFFNRSFFADSAGFSRAEFQGDTDFSEAEFQNGAAFFEATFTIGADFARSSFAGRADFRGAYSLKPLDFSNVRYWPNTIGHWYRRKLLGQWSFGLTWRKAEDQTVEPRWLTRQLLPLKEFPSGPPKEPTEFLIESSAISEVSNPLFKRYIADMLFIRAFRTEYPVLAWLWQWSADYGRSLIVWAFWSTMVVLFFAFLYTPGDAAIPLLGWTWPEWWQNFWLEHGPRFQQSTGAYADQPLNFWSAAYFSVVTFTTLGFGDIATANGTARVVTTAEVILGYIMLGGLISILAHKLARRS